MYGQIHIIYPYIYIYGGHTVHTYHVGKNRITMSGMNSNHTNKTLTPLFSPIPASTMVLTLTPPGQITFANIKQHDCNDGFMSSQRNRDERTLTTQSYGHMLPSEHSGDPNRPALSWPP